MIELTNIKYFYKKKLALDIPHLRINDGEKIAFMGLNGSGKTTLAELILNLRAKHQGQLTISKDYCFNAVFQDCNFNGELTIEEIFYLYCSLYKIQANHYAFFTTFDLNDVTKNKFKSLSGGQQQKFKFLICLLNKPNFLVLDEITTSLDYVWRIKILDLITEHLTTISNCNLLLVSHNPEEIARLCDRVLIINKGQIAKDFTLSGTYETKLVAIESEINWNV